MKTVDDLVMESSLLDTELAKIPKDKLDVLRILTNGYVMDCLNRDVEGMEFKKNRIERYMTGISKRYDVNTDYFEHMISAIETYYTKRTNKIVF